MATKTNTAAPAAATNFRGFSPEGLRFLRDLADNNDPDWFKPRKDTYETLVRGPMIALVADLLTLAAARKIPLTGDPTKAVFRIHRDVRFSKDKRPYKTHCGASLSRTGERLAPGLFYVHIEPGGCFAAAGFWHAEPPVLEAFRAKILAAPSAFETIARALAANGMPIAPDDEAAKRLPRGCEAGRDTPVEPFLKYRNIIARHSLSDDDVYRADLPNLLLDRFTVARPLLDFGWAVVDTLRL